MSREFGRSFPEEAEITVKEKDLKNDKDHSDINTLKSSKGTSHNYNYLRNRGESVKLSDEFEEYQKFFNQSPIEAQLEVLQMEAFEEYVQREAASNPEIQKIKKQITPEGIADAGYQKKLHELVERVFSWIKINNLNVLKMKRLGGGFKNPVILIHTREMKSFVAKAFMETEGAEISHRAQQQFEELCQEDEKFIPELITWLDDKSIVSEKASGYSIRDIVEQYASKEVNQEVAEKALETLGKTLAIIHRRTLQYGKGGEQSIAEANVDVQKMMNHLDQLSFLFPEVQALKMKIQKDFSSDHVSLIHADSHLDNFFTIPNGDSLEIVDYDDIRLGDPNVDFARSFASLESWCSAYAIPEELANDLERSFIRGYSSVRNVENINEINAFRLRLFIIKLKNFYKSDTYKTIRKKIENLEIHPANIFQENFMTELTQSDRLSNLDKALLKDMGHAYEQIKEYLQEDFNSIEELVKDKKDSLNEEEFVHTLTSAGIPIGEWGKGETKTLQHLIREIEKGDSRLIQGEKGELVREVNAVNIDVIYEDENGVIHRLKEDHQRFKDGRVRKCTINASMAEKMKADEPVIDAVKRGLRE